MSLRARIGRNQQGLCFVSKDMPSGSFKLNRNGSSMIIEVRTSEKVPTGTLIVDSRVSEMLGVTEGREVSLVPISSQLPTCEKIQLGVVSKRGLENEKVAQAMSKRIDDFREHMEGLIFYEGQKLTVSDLGIELHILSLEPKDSTTSAAKISWKQLLKIHLAPVVSHPYNLCILVETAAATQIVDIKSDDRQVSRHQAIMSSLRNFESQYTGFSGGVLFSGIAFADEVLSFTTFDPQTGEESEVSTLHSSSLLKAFGEWTDDIASQKMNAPSNPGEALIRGLASAKTLSEKNNLQTALVLFSTGVYSAGQNPVKIARTESGINDVVIFALSLGSDSGTDIMQAIAEEGDGLFIHLDHEEKTETIIDTIERCLFRKR
ncbi:MAG: hypothetical protein ACXAAO_03265 [Candidatus Thorarchaeota archaeon]